MINQISFYLQLKLMLIEMTIETKAIYTSPPTVPCTHIKYHHGRRWSRAMWSTGGGESAIIQSRLVESRLTHHSFTVTDVLQSAQKKKRHIRNLVAVYHRVISKSRFARDQTNRNDAC